MKKIEVAHIYDTQFLLKMYIRKTRKYTCSTHIKEAVPLHAHTNAYNPHIHCIVF